MGVRIEVVDKRELTDDQIRQLWQLREALREEILPEDPPVPFEVAEPGYRHHLDHETVRYALAYDGDRLAGAANVTASFTGFNEHLGDCLPEVHPDHRRQRVGTSLLRAGLDELDDLDRSTVFAWTNDRCPAGEVFASQAGFTAGLVSHINRLVLAEIDRAMIDAWIAEGPTRSAGYALEWMPSPIPEEHIAEVAVGYGIMNDAPRDDLDMEDEELTPELIRSWEGRMIATGRSRWALWARHEESGELIGFTEVSFQPANPTTVFQMGTGVRRDHRGHALGKWLKASMLARVLDECPERVDLRTENADSNDPMLGINTQLGFRPFLAETVWQAPVTEVRKALA